MLRVEDLSETERRTIAGYVDAACPSCAARRRYFDYVATMGYDGAIWYLRGRSDAIQSTVDILENQINDYVRSRQG